MADLSARPAASQALCPLWDSPAAHSTSGLCGSSRIQALLLGAVQDAALTCMGSLPCPRRMSRPSWTNGSICRKCHLASCAAAHAQILMAVGRSAQAAVVTRPLHPNFRQQHTMPSLIPPFHAHEAAPRLTGLFPLFGGLVSVVQSSGLESSQGVMRIPPFPI